MSYVKLKELMHVSDTHLASFYGECRVNAGWNTGLERASAARLAMCPSCKQGISRVSGVFTLNWAATNPEG